MGEMWVPNCSKQETLQSISIPYFGLRMSEKLTSIILAPLDIGDLLDSTASMTLMGIVI